jgi:uncharacterized protein (DUF1778 family)
MANDIIDPGATSTTALTLEVEEETRRLLVAAADHEGRSLSSAPWLRFVRGCGAARQAAHRDSGRDAAHCPV